ncbi:type VI secretion system tip protein TssI/VgrG [Polyangium sp. 6x1]|uniref:type VI secretion system tip protein TssI/VgrG n=1 Tax=Polyangium sp. 6x1 TaxID=3042689 RepID=UPI002482D4CD|nr:type VI secretion system tip protein TssI/VgrG [Polyangium sp. 6x1]MDI1448342.1 type VI secretion system tip protein TssI/VgrG [Polyangium sp. 6x1]
MISSSTSLFELHLGPLGALSLAVVSFRGREALSKPFSFDLLATAPPPFDLLETSLLGQPATLVIRVHDQNPRIVHGVVASISPEATTKARDRYAIRIRLVPRLWLLKHRVTSRIFQNRTVPEIIGAVLEQAGVRAAFKLSRSYPARTYCVQYQESDYAFIQRLIAEEGMFYTFEQPSGLLENFVPGAASGVIAAALDHAETVVFGDSAEAYAALPGGALFSAEINASVSPSGDVSMYASATTTPSPHLPLRDISGTNAPEDVVTSFSLRRKVRPSSTLLRDYDFRRPLLDLRSEAKASANGLSLSASASADPRVGVKASVDLRTSDTPTTVAGDLRVYEHRGEYDEPEVNPTRARVELEQHRRNAVHGEGTSTVRHLSPGRRFHLDAETNPSLSQEYVATRVEHEGHTPELTSTTVSTEAGPRVYQNRFECVPASVVFRPKRPRRSLRQVLESATVVGPEGEEIYTDEHGRIKVQFHWDLDGKRNEHSSCWLRVVQTWSGASWGFQFIPRIGMEVMVTFLGGDQDCPIVTGCTYNATHPPPFMLPQNKTRSGVRTRSTPRDEGFNELSFEDSAGREQVYVHAQRDFDEVIERNQTSDVRGHRVENVVGNRSAQVGRDDTLAVLGNQGVQVNGDARLSVKQNRTTSIDGDDTTTVRGNASLHVVRNHSLSVDGDHSVVIGNGVREAQSDTYVFGSASIGASERLVLRAEGGLVIECGQSAIEIGPSGITLRGSSIDVKAAQSATMSGKGPTLSLDSEVELVAKKISLYSEGASVELDKEASIKGDKVLLNCDAGEPEGDEDENRKETQPFSCKLSDWYMMPYANKKYHLMAEGLKYEGTTDADGVVQQKLPKGVKQVVIKLWVDEYPTGRQRLYTLSMAEVPPADTPQGAQARLRALGFYFGKPTEEMNADTKSALTAFQKDHAQSHGLEATGELDATTVAALQDVYGS